MKRVGIALIGCGTVGGATAVHLMNSTGLVAQRYGLDLQLVAVVDKELANARRIGVPDEILTDNLDAVLARNDVHIVVELVGGTTFARTVIRSAFEHGKHVVTANKALLAHHGVELFRAARQADRALAFEASCGGGIPLVRSITDGLAGSRIDAVYGIVNGTCNFILSEMISKSISYGTALARAQEDGLAEADPTLDVSGQDSAHKIALLAALAFGVQVDFDAIPVQGIDSLDLVDVTWATRLGYVPKLLAIAERDATGISLRVRPSFVPERHPLAWVSGPFNAVSIYGYPTGHTMYYGRGAGGSATSSAIVSDIVSIANGSYVRVFLDSSIWPDQTAPVHQNAPGEIAGRYYVRAMVEDRPGMIAEMAARYGNHGISLASVHQDETAETSSGEPVPVVVLTHHATEDNLMNAVSEVNALSKVHGECSVISIIDEAPEQLIVS
jgi:homoserine dehydrogenase